MAGYRQIHPKIWKDEWFIELEPAEKLFFIYLFSNDETTFAGLYKLPLRVMINETGLAKECIIEMLDKFARAGKVLFENGIIWVVNMRRHHPSNSPKVTARIDADMVLIPDCDLKRKCMQSLNMIPIPYLYPTDTESLKDEDKIKEDEDENESATPLMLLNDAFISKTGMTGTRPADNEALVIMAKAGALPEDMIDGIDALGGDYTIVGPASVKTAVLNCMRKRTHNQKDGYTE